MPVYILTRTDTHVTIGTSATAPINVSATNKWSTCILPFDSELPSGVKAFECASFAGEYLDLTEANSIAAYTPYILYSESGYSGSLTGTVDAINYPSSGFVRKGLLNGTVKKTIVTEGYVLQNLNGAVMFYKIKEGDEFAIPSEKCWLVTSEPLMSAYRFSVDNETAIQNVSTTSNEESSEIYNLQGVQFIVCNLTKYI